MAQNGYTESTVSPTFPNLDIIKIIPQLVEQAFTQGTRKTLKNLRQSLLE